MKTLLFLSASVFFASPTMAINCVEVQYADHKEMRCGGSVTEDRTERVPEKQPSKGPNCQIIKYPDHDEAICAGEHGNESSVPPETPADIRGVRSTRAVGASYEPTYQEPARSPEVTVSGIVVSATPEGNDNKEFLLNLKCDVESSVTYNNFIVVVVGKDIDGLEIVGVSLRGGVLAGKSKALTGSTSIRAQKYRNIHTWEVKSTSADNSVLTLRGKNIDRR